MGETTGRLFSTFTYFLEKLLQHQPFLNPTVSETEVLEVRHEVVRYVEDKMMSFYVSSKRQHHYFLLSGLPLSVWREHLSINVQVALEPVASALL